MRILLVRHGRSAHVHSGWLDHAALEGWRDAYDSAGIMPDDLPPAPLRALAADAGIVVTSDMPRAIESGARLLPGADIMRSALISETPLPIPALGRARLPLAAWGMLIGWRWLRSMKHEAIDAQTPPRIRGYEAARWLAELAGKHESVLVVTHGSFRHYLADALEARGWSRDRTKRAYHNWSVWGFQRSV